MNNWKNSISFLIQLNTAMQQKRCIRHAKRYYMSSSLFFYTLILIRLKWPKPTKQNSDRPLLSSGKSPQFPTCVDGQQDHTEQKHNKLLHLFLCFPAWVFSALRSQPEVHRRCGEKFSSSSCTSPTELSGSCYRRHVHSQSPSWIVHQLMQK